MNDERMEMAEVSKEQGKVVKRLSNATTKELTELSNFLVKRNVGNSNKLRQKDKMIHWVLR